jgi:hypothetical protein
VARLNSSYNNIDAAQRQYRLAGISDWERNSIMTMLTQLDRDITTQMNDQDQSRYKYWNAGNKSWSQNWWKPGWNHNSGNNVSVNTDSSDFNQEIDSYQRDLKNRIDRGRSSGALTPSELNRLMSAYAEIDRTQQQYRMGGFNHTERNSLMTSLTQLDRDITSQLRDDNNSHYRQWDPNKNTWNQSWWKNNVGNNNSNVNTGDTYGYGHRSAQSEAFNTEVNDEQKRVKELLIRGQRNGHLTAAEAADLNRQYDEIDRLQAQYRGRGFSKTERDSVMQKLQALNTSLTTNMRDSERNANWQKDNRDARIERKDNRWDNNRDRNNSTVSNPPAVVPTTPNNNNNNNNGRGWGNRDRDDRNQNNSTVVTPPATSTPPANTNNNSNNNDNRGWGGNRNRNQNTGIVPPTEVKPTTPVTPTTPTTPTTPSTGSNQQDQGDQDRGRGGRRRRGNDQN